MNIFSGAIGVIIGFFVVKYSFQISNGLGQIPFAEKYFGTTTSFYRFVGIVIIILSFLYMFGGLGSLIAPLDNIF